MSYFRGVSGLAELIGQPTIEAQPTIGAQPAPAFASGSLLTGISPTAPAVPAKPIPVQQSSSKLKLALILGGVGIGAYLLLRRR